MRFAKDQYLPRWLRWARVFGSHGLRDEATASRTSYFRWIVASRVRNKGSHQSSADTTIPHPVLTRAFWGTHKFRRGSKGRHPRGHSEHNHYSRMQGAIIPEGKIWSTALLEGGRAWENSSEKGLKKVNTAVGLDQTTLFVPVLGAPGA